MILHGILLVLPAISGYSTPHCSENWSAAGRYCYARLSQKFLSYYQAVDACRNINRNARLPVLETQDDNRAFRDYWNDRISEDYKEYVNLGKIKGVDHDCATWISLERHSSSVRPHENDDRYWKWSPQNYTPSEVLTYSDWTKHQPNNWRGQDCTCFSCPYERDLPKNYDVVLWGDVHCPLQAPFTVCQMDKGYQGLKHKAFTLFFVQVRLTLNVALMKISIKMLPHLVPRQQFSKLTNSETEQLSYVGWQSWWDIKTWKSINSHVQSLLHAEMVPSQFDAVEFLKDEFPRLTFECTGAAIWLLFIRNGTNLNDHYFAQVNSTNWDYAKLVRGTGILFFNECSTKPGISLMQFARQSCATNSCLNSNIRQHQMQKICQYVQCPNYSQYECTPINVTGHCCLVCGVMYKLSTTDTFRSMDLQYALSRKLIDAKSPVSISIMTIGNNQQQIVLAQTSFTKYTYESLHEANLLLQRYIDQDGLVNILQEEISVLGSPGQFNSNIWLSMILILVLPGLYCVYRFRAAVLARLVDTKRVIVQHLRTIAELRKYAADSDSALHMENPNFVQGTADND